MDGKERETSESERRRGSVCEGDEGNVGRCYGMGGLGMSEWNLLLRSESVGREREGGVTFDPSFLSLPLSRLFSPQRFFDPPLLGYK
jgi:hypothetical protein